MSHFSVPLSFFSFLFLYKPRSPVSLSLTTWNPFCSLDCLQEACTVTLSCRQSTGVFVLVLVCVCVFQSVCVCELWTRDGACCHTWNILHGSVCKSGSQKTKNKKIISLLKRPAKIEEDTKTSFTYGLDSGTLRLSSPDLLTEHLQETATHTSSVKHTQIISKSCCMFPLQSLNQVCH